jgi:hypothetical protein
MGKLRSPKLWDRQERSEGGLWLSTLRNQEDTEESIKEIEEEQPRWKEEKQTSYVLEEQSDQQG